MFYANRPIARAYDNMTRDAAPMVGTPSKKRSRTIAASDATASNEPISPHRYEDSDPRPLKRLCNSELESRRMSAPLEMEKSPLKTSHPTDMPHIGDFRRAVMKHEPIVCIPHISSD